MMTTMIYNLVDAFFVGRLVQGFQPVASYNFGARKYARLRRGRAFTVRTGTLVLGILALIGLTFPSPIIRLFPAPVPA